MYRDPRGSIYHPHRDETITLSMLVGCFVVRDSGAQWAYVCEDQPGRRSAAKLLTRDEARRIAANLVKLPHLLTAR